MIPRLKPSALLACIFLTAALPARAAEGPPAAPTGADTVAAQAGDLSAHLVTEAIGLSPGDLHWKAVPAKTLILMPQTVTVPKGGGAVKQVQVQALQVRLPLGVPQGGQAGEWLYVRLEWADPTQDVTLGYTEGFSDACAIQIPLRSDPLPSAFMGQANQPVSIWFWKAVWEKPREATPATVDLYPAGNWAAGQSAGNPQSLMERPSAAEHLLAEGYGTLTAAPLEGLEAQGRWQEGRWAVVFRRSLASSDLEKSPDLKPGARVPMAFAIWDGASRERGAIKSVTLNWNWLALMGDPAEAQGQ